MTATYRAAKSGGPLKKTEISLFESTALEGFVKAEVQKPALDESISMA